MVFVALRNGQPLVLVLIGAAPVLRMKDIPRPCFRFYCCTRAVSTNDFTQPGP